MYEPSIEEIVTYLSTKLNKIFYDREFVSCVSQDFHKLRNTNKRCVLVFPALGPVYQRALKYQAKAFDLASFGLSGGTFRTIAVCQRDHLLNEHSQKIPEEKEKMSSELPQDVTTRRKRPERKLYVPPAQRRLAQNTEVKPEGKHSKSSVSSTSNENAKAKVDTKPKRLLKRQGSKQSDKSEKMETDIVAVENDLKQVNINEFAARILSLHDLMDLNFLPLPKYSCNLSHRIDENILSLKNFHECSCEFHKYLISRCENVLEFFIPIYHLSDMNFLQFLINNYFCWQPLSTDDLINFEEIIENNCAIRFFNYIKNADDSDYLKSDLTKSFTLNQEKLCIKIKNHECERSKIMHVNSVGDKCETDTIFREDFDIGNFLRIVCDNEPFENIVDLTNLAMGHYFKIPSDDGSEYFHVCDMDHDVKKCYMEVKQKLSSENNSETIQSTSKLVEEDYKPEQSVRKNEDIEVVEIQARQIETPSNAVIENNLEVLKCEMEERSPEVKTEPKVETKAEKPSPKIQTEPEVEKVIDKPSAEVINKPRATPCKEMKDSKKKSEHETEKEIMRKAKENMKRKTRSLMKYSDDSDDLLKIDKQDNVNNWEDLFDDNGQIQEELLTEIVHKVGKDMTIVKATEDYTPYMQKPADDLEHVVEIYNFPPSLSTGDIIHAFSMFDSDAMYIVWVDDTHALLVLGSSLQAQKAMEMKNPLIKVRSMSSASAAAVAMAGQYDLKPAMKRPQTNLQTARRLITNHLGTKSQVTKEQTAKERELLRQAREKRNLTKKNERDAWEGNIHSSLRQ